MFRLAWELVCKLAEPLFLDGQSHLMAEAIAQVIMNHCVGWQEGYSTLQMVLSRSCKRKANKAKANAQARLLVRGKFIIRPACQGHKTPYPVYIPQAYIAESKVIRKGSSHFTRGLFAKYPCKEGEVVGDYKGEVRYEK